MLRDRLRMTLLGSIAAILAGGAGCTNVMPPTAPGGDRDAVAASATSAGVRDNALPSAQAHESPAAREFYPQVVGETRRYLYTYTSQTTWEDGHSEPMRTGSSIHVRRVVCVEQRDDRSTYVESFQRSDRIYYWLRYHQDRTGLVADYSTARTPPECAPGSADEVAAGFGTNAEWNASTPAAGRVVRVLDYPLHVGARWLRDPDNPKSEAVVEALEVIDVPAGRFAAWRIRLSEEDPEGRGGRTWYSRAGFIKRESGDSYTGTSELGGNYRVVSTSSEVLVSVTREPDEAIRGERAEAR